MDEYHTTRINGLAYYVHFIECFCEVLNADVITFFLEKDLGVTVCADIKFRSSVMLQLERVIKFFC